VIKLYLPSIPFKYYFMLWCFKQFVIVDRFKCTLSARTLASRTGHFVASSKWLTTRLWENNNEQWYSNAIFFWRLSWSIINNMVKQQSLNKVDLVQNKTKQNACAKCNLFIEHIRYFPWIMLQSKQNDVGKKT